MTDQHHNVLRLYTALKKAGLHPGAVKRNKEGAPYFRADCPACATRGRTLLVVPGTHGYHAILLFCERHCNWRRIILAWRRRGVEEKLFYASAGR